MYLARSVASLSLAVVLVGTLVGGAAGATPDTGRCRASRAPSGC